MESLARVLRRIPFFADLPAGSFARVIADLREERYAAGTLICLEGDPAQDFYIIKAGEVHVLVNRSGNQRELVAVNGVAEWFGERALFSDAPRSATVVAGTDVDVWRLPKEKFSALIEENPGLMFHFAEVISDRLYRGNQELSKIQSAFARQMEALFQAQSAECRRFMLCTSVLAQIDVEIAAELAGVESCDAHLREVLATAAFTSSHDGQARYLDAVREFLRLRLEEEVGRDGVRQLEARAGALYEAAGIWDRAVDHYLAAELPEAAARLVSKNLSTLLVAGQVDCARRWLRQLPAAIVQGELRTLQSQVEAADAGRNAEVVGTDAGDADRRRVRRNQGIAAIVGVGAGIGLAFAPPFSGLSPEGMQMLGLLAWAAVFWAFDVLPDYVVGLAMMLAWIVFKIVPAEIAVSGFTTGPFFLIIGVLGIGASLQASGLLFRMALQVLRRFPLTHSGQTLGLALTGTAVTPGIPDSTSGAAIAGPIILALSDCLGYARRSNGSAGLAMAAVLGFGQMSPFFLTGAAENLLAWGLLSDPVRAQITWGGWALMALPLSLVTFVCGFLMTQLLLPPEAQPSTSRGLIETQIEALGPVSRAEWINGFVLLAALLGWVTAPYHGVDVAWVAMIGIGILLAVNLLDRVTFRAGIYWDFLFYLGAVLSLTGVVRHLRVDAWVIALFEPVLQPLAASPAYFLLTMALIVFAARFVLPSFPLVSVLIITVVPIAEAAGIHPFALTLVICTTVAVWFLPYQSTYYLALYFGTKEKAFSHGQVRLLAWAYGAIYLLAIAVAIPYWRWMGLLP